MGQVKDKAADVYRDFQVPGVPASGANDPDKASIRKLFTTIDQTIAAAIAGIVYYATGAERQADTTRPIGTLAKAADETDYYRKTADGWVIDNSVYDGVAGLVTPIAERAEAAAQVAEVAVPPVSQAVVASRTALVAREPVANTFLVSSFDGLTVTARGVDLTDGAAAFETWISTTSGSADRLTFSLYSRTLSGAANDGAPRSGDVLLLSETRLLDQLPGGFSRDGSANHLTIDFLKQFAPDPSKLYLLVITIKAGETLVPFGFLQGRGVDSGDPSYPQANGYFRETGATTWANFATNTTAAFRWLSAERPGAVASAADALSLGKTTRLINIGAPEAVLTATTSVADVGIWWNEWPAVQGGLSARLYASTNSAAWLTFHLASRGQDGGFVTQRSASVYAPGAGNFSFSAGDVFDAFTIEQGWYVGVEQAPGITALLLNSLGNCWYQDILGARSYVRGKTPAFGVELSVSDLPVAPVDMKRRRALLWREDLTSTVPPVGWDTDATAITYGTDGLTIGASVPNSWATRVYTNRYVRTDERVTEVDFTAASANDRLGILTGKPASAQFLDAGNSNSAIEINGVNSTLAIKTSSAIGDGSAGDPGNVASVAIGFSLVAGRRYRVTWTRDGFVHTVYLIDTVTGARSAVLTSGNPDFVGTPGTGVDTPEGFQNGALGFIFVAGRPKINSVAVSHDGISPSLYVGADSIGAGVYIPRANGWAAQFRARGIPAILSAQPGGSTYGATFAAWWEIPASRPRVAINAAGTNDVLIGFNVANSRWMLASFLDLAARVGAIPALTVLAPLPGKDVGPHNAMVRALAASRPGTLLLRYDKALTVGGDGSTPDTAKLFPDLVHPRQTGADAIATFAELNVPEILG